MCNDKIVENLCTKKIGTSKTQAVRLTLDKEAEESFSLFLSSFIP